MSADEFYEAAMQPGFPNTMAFDLEKKREDEGTFSREGVEAIVDQMHDFVFARIKGRWDESNKPPQRMRIKVDIDFEPIGDVEDEVNAGEGWHAHKDSGIAVPDGELRARVARRR